MEKSFKKNWFIVLLAVLLVGVSCFYIYDTNKGKLKGKTANGEDVVYEVNGQDITASQFYDELYKNNGVSSVAHYMLKAIASTVETTDEMKTMASAQAESIISNYRQSYPTNYEQVIGASLQQAGYSGFDDLQEYLLQYQKQTKITSDYAKAQTEELKIRNISYILVKFEDSANPSEEGAPSEDESARMGAVDATMNESGFEEAAKQHSEDSSSASSGGILGTIDANTSNLDSAFLNAALALNEGETSDWVYSKNFGYFRIKNNASTQASLEALAEEDGMDPYEELVSSYDTSLSAKALWAKAEELGLDFKDNAELESAIRTYFGMDAE